jgi:hypothetical protein
MLPFIYKNLRSQLKMQDNVIVVVFDEKIIKNNDSYKTKMEAYIFEFTEYELKI